MFPPESIWGQLGRWAHSKVHMEPCMFFNALDKEVVLHLRASTAAPPAADSETAPVPLTMWQPEDFLLRREHPAYLGRVERIDTLSGSQLASLRRFYNLYRPAAAEWPANCVIEATAKFLRWAWAGPLALEAGKWFLSRPAPEDPTMWFGRVQGIIAHVGPDGRERVVLMADWFPATVDTTMRCPVVSSMPVVHPDGPWWFAETVVPWDCWALPHPRRAGSQDSSPSATETVVREMLSKKHADFTGPYASREQRAAAPFLPTSFKQALTQLQDVGGCRWPRLIRYDMCPCGFIYRGPEYRGADHCGGMVPGPRAGEWIACPGPSHGTDDFAGDVSEEEVEADEEPASGRGRQHARELEEELPGGRRSRGRGRTGRDGGRGSRGAVTANTRGAGVARRGRRGRSPVNAVRGNAVGQPGVIAGDVSEEEVEADEEPASGRGRQHARELEEELPGGRHSRGRGRTGRDGGRGGEVDALEQRVVEAVCLVELCLSVNEMDIKLHNLLHLVDSIKNIGPLFAASMFPPESIWGQLGRWAHSKVHMEPCMFFNALDKEVVLHLRASTAAPPAADSETAPVPLTMWQPEDFLLRREHPAYLGRVERIDTLSGSQLASLRRFYNLYRPAAAEWPANCVIEATAKFLRWAWAGPLALEAGKWFLSRPAPEDPTMWFGRVQGRRRQGKKAAGDEGGGEEGGSGATRA
ncbi:hypothetical protein VOLCADRAFT_104850 [Volvox carteri f. nagariensis]|uniref:Uncharacterized protein n=1 Tax=Volvox carteri f. nagariensis TaxID=3068 RepID=D8TWI7_VOLCA|nr:uncharacterized protein VOLCADRAFT_104850 [Volvox carteri f. nagariensis]EFJ48161.1 hypothetical protein VOLCADRAFT_104850 [Volvox carteri f. nagariensis]|eukprot:XP_002950846.1 hypothetical protein VOLCADRAFT_104850 [Volvox carteri f. nagariensis]